MMRRIDWNAQVDGENGAEPEYDDDTPLGEETVNECTCVWKGTTPKPKRKRPIVTLRDSVTKMQQRLTWCLDITSCESFTSKTGYLVSW